MKRKMDEINRQIEMNKKEIELLHTAVNEDVYSPSRPVSPPASSANPNAIPALANISLPSNIVDILKSIQVTSASAAEMASTTAPFDLMEEYMPSHMMTHISDYVPTIAASSSAGAPSKLAQMTDEELLRMVPDDSLIDIAPPPSKKTKIDFEPLPPGIEEDEYVP